ncbi:MAG: helicase HerA-like domain-containing protein [Candidatus Eiseniibacteriota bacterium]
MAKDRDGKGASGPEAFRDALSEGYRFAGPSVALGAALRDGAVHADLPISASLSLLNRHGLVAGTTGTGKTKTLQGMAEKLSAAGVPVFLADLKGDLSGLLTPGEASPKVLERAQSLGVPFEPAGFPVEFLSLTGGQGAPVRATVADFGPLLLARALDLNDTQSSVLALVFKFADDQGLPLLDLTDLRAVIAWLAGDDPPDLSQYGGLSKSTADVLARKLTELEAQGAGGFFGEPAFDVRELLRTAPDGRGMISILELADVQDRPRLFSTFLMWLLAELYEELPERGDAEKPLLVFFFDEAHYLFDDASKALTEKITQVVRLIRSKGIGIFFVTQTPKDVPADVLGQLGNRVQHALRAYTPDDAKRLKATVSTFPTTPFYDLEETLTTLGTGEAVISVLAESGAPAPVAACRMLPPRSRMAPLAPEELARALDASTLRARLAQAVDRESAREMLAARLAGAPAPAPEPSGREVGGPVPASPAGSRRPGSARPESSQTGPARPRGPSGGAQVATAAAAVLGGLFKFATSRAGQAVIRGVLGTRRRR